VARNTPDCGEQIPFYALRSVVRPGITGWAQVRYRYANDLEEEIEKMRYDLYYIKHRSVWLDLRILLETVGIVMRGRESADDADPAARAAGRRVPSGAAGGPRTWHARTVHGAAGSASHTDRAPSGSRARLPDGGASLTDPVVPPPADLGVIS
jgi:hypothetical protein